jgi:hypothetical protein
MVPTKETMILKIIFPVAIIVILSACGSSSVSRAELEEASKRVLDHTYMSTFDATLATIRNQGFEIVINNMETGNIEGFFDMSPEIQRRDFRTNRSRQLFFVGFDPKQVVAMILEAHIVQVNENSSLVVLQIIEELPGQAGSPYAATITENTRRPVRKIELYNALFDDILTHLN